MSVLHELALWTSAAEATEEKTKIVSNILKSLGGIIGNSWGILPPAIDKPKDPDEVQKAPPEPEALSQQELAVLASSYRFNEPARILQMPYSPDRSAPIPPDAVKAWHFTDGKALSRTTFEIPVLEGMVYSVTGSPTLCIWGLHASRHLIDAAGYAPLSGDPHLSLVMVWGDVKTDTSKLTGRYRYVVKTVAVKNSILLQTLLHAYWDVGHLLLPTDRSRMIADLKHWVDNEQIIDERRLIHHLELLTYAEDRMRGTQHLNSMLAMLRRGAYGSLITKLDTKRTRIIPDIEARFDDAYWDFQRENNARLREIIIDPQECERGRRLQVGGA